MSPDRCEYHEEMVLARAALGTRVEDLASWTEKIEKKVDHQHGVIIERLDKIDRAINHEKGARWMLGLIGGSISAGAALAFMAWRMFWHGGNQ